MEYNERIIIMTKNLKTLIAMSLLLLLTLSSFAACDEKSAELPTTADGNVDYQKIDITDYIELSEKEYEQNTVTLGTSYLVKDEDVDAQIKKTLFNKKTKTNGDTKVTDQPIKHGDSAFIYYTGYLDGEAFSGGSNASDETPYELSIGSGSFIDGFEDGLIGIVPSSTSKDAPYDLNLTFPKDYKSEELAGKSVVFKVWIEYVIQYTVPSLTDEYVKETLKFDGTTAEYKADIKKNMQAELTEKAEDEALSAIITKLIEASTIKSLPEVAVDYWYNMYIKQLESEMQYFNTYGPMYGYNYNFQSLDEFAPMYLGIKDGEDWKAEVTELAENMVESELLCNIIAKQQNYTITEEEYNKRVDDFVKQYSTTSKTYTREEIIEEIGEAQIIGGILSEKVSKHLMDRCTIEYKDQ